MTDRETYRTEFTTLDTATRRAIIRTVNRGQAVETRKYARVAVAVARRQLRFWKYAWLVGPALGLLQLTVSPPEVALANGMFGTLILAGFAWFWIRRARRAEELNLTIAEGRIGPPRRNTTRAGGADSGSGGSSSSTSTSGTDTSRSQLPGVRPPSPRGKKRRGKKR